MLQMDTLIMTEARRESFAWKRIGVAVDLHSADGLRYLEQIGGFATVAAGGEWTNPLARWAVIEPFGGPRALPQVLIVEHRRGSIRTSDGTLQMRIRLVGLGAILFS
jgi:hypothetical protein